MRMIRDVIDGRRDAGDGSGRDGAPRSILDRVVGDEDKPFAAGRSFGSTLGDSVG